MIAARLKPTSAWPEGRLSPSVTSTVRSISDARPTHVAKPYALRRRRSALAAPCAFIVSYASQSVGIGTVLILQGIESNLQGMTEGTDSLVTMADDEGYTDHDSVTEPRARRIGCAQVNGE